MSRIIREVSEYKREMTSERMKIPVVFHVQESLMPNEATLAQLESVASNDCCFHHIAAMADVHSKPGRKNATGTTIVSKNFILPQVNDSDPACGMRLVRTNMNESNTTPRDIHQLFTALIPKVPTKSLFGTYLPFQLVVDICRKGIEPLIEYLGIETKFETENSMNLGNFFGQKMNERDILDAIPGLFLFFAQFRSGILGAAGNHFLDLMKVTGLENEPISQKLGIRNGDYLFMVHCGSGILGQYTMYLYTAKKREHLSQALMVTLGRMLFQTPHKKIINEIAKKIRAYDYGKKEPLFTFDGNGDEGRLYMTARNACSNFAHANRAVITHTISKTIKRVLGHDPNFELLYDMPHILVSQEEHYGEKVWVHRNGTTRAFGPSRMSRHPIFKETGEPAFIPTSMSTEAYLVVGTDSNESSFYSANHGAGKSKNKTDSIVPTNKEELDRKLEKKGIRLYNGRSSKVIEQDAAHYKLADEVIASIRQNNIAIPVARLQPVAVIMY